MEKNQLNYSRNVRSQSTYFLELPRERQKSQLPESIRKHQHAYNPILTIRKKIEKKFENFHTTTFVQQLKSIKRTSVAHAIKL